jgi:hypothetical protein
MLGPPVRGGHGLCFDSHATPENVATDDVSKFDDKLVPRDVGLLCADSQTENIGVFSKDGAA